MHRRRLSFENCHHPVDLINCDELTGVIRDILPTWTFTSRTLRTDDNGGADVIVIRKTTEGYTRISPWLSQPVTYADPVNAVCDFLVDLVKAYNDARPDFMCLHSAAVDIQEKLVLFPDAYNVGKSLFSAHLVAVGARLFSDDVLPFDPASGEGIALGCKPRLRLPLPDNIDNRFLEFYHQRQGAHSQRFQYLDLLADEQAPFDARLPVGAIVLLSRSPGQAPQLEQAPPNDIIKSLVLRNFARKAGGRAILESLIDLAGRVPCYRLLYDDCASAAGFLQEHLKPGQAAAVKHPESSPPENSKCNGQHGRNDNKKNITAGQWYQSPGVFSKTIDQDRFLVNRQNNVIFHLNIMAGIIWDLIEIPATAPRITADLRQLFPDVDPRTIETDVKDLLAKLAANHLVDKAS